MKIDEKQLDRTAQLAPLELSDDEKKEFPRQLSDIIQYVEKINTMDTEGIKPADHIVDLKNVFRADIPGESLPQETLAEFSPEFADGHFIVPRIIDN